MFLDVYSWNDLNSCEDRVIEVPSCGEKITESKSSSQTSLKKKNTLLINERNRARAIDPAYPQFNKLKQRLVVKIVEASRSSRQKSVECCFHAVNSSRLQSLLQSLSGKKYLKPVLFNKITFSDESDTTSALCQQFSQATHTPDHDIRRTQKAIT